jgi:hypothetical protein
MLLVLTCLLSNPPRVERGPPLTCPGKLAPQTSHDATSTHGGISSVSPLCAARRRPLAGGDPPDGVSPQGPLPRGLQGPDDRRERESCECRTWQMRRRLSASISGTVVESCHAPANLLTIGSLVPWSRGALPLRDGVMSTLASTSIEVPAPTPRNREYDIVTKTATWRRGSGSKWQAPKPTGVDDQPPWREQRFC